MRWRERREEARELEKLLGGELVFSPGTLELLGMKSDEDLYAEVYEEVHGKKLDKTAHEFRRGRSQP